MRQRNSQINRDKPRRIAPKWMAVGIVVAMFVMLCVSINYRSFSVMNAEVREYDQLTTKIQAVTDENLQIQEEIHNLKSDPRTVKREAQRLGLAPREKVSVPTN